MPRLTRKEKQAQTRECLMHSAAKVFTKRGLQQASIDEVAEDAGFTKGAFYANFRSKEELFLAMLDERFAQRLEEIERVLATEDTLEDQTRQVGAGTVAAMRSDPEWERLFFEFAAYAARNEEFREELVTRHRALVQCLSEAFRQHVDALGGKPPVDADRIALMTTAMANGVALEKLPDPEGVPEEVF